MSVTAVARKELRQLSRDPRTLAVLVIFPAALLLFYGYVISFDVRHVSLAVLDHDRSDESRALVATMTASEYFDRVAELSSERQLRPALDGGHATVALVIPPSFAADIRNGEAPAVQALIDGSNATSAETAQGYVELFVTAFGARLAAASGRGAEPPLSARLRVLYNPELSSDKFLLPGLVAFILMIAAAMATALSIVRERETGTMEQLLVSPLSAADVVLGKAIPYGAASVLAAVIVLATARFAFGLEIQGSYALLLLFTVVFVAGAEGLGLLISSVTASQQVAFQMATFITILPTLLLSGFIFPIRSMPVPLQVLTFIVPARYFITALRGVVLKGVGLEVVWPQLLALVLFTGAVLGLAMARTRRIRL